MASEITMFGNISPRTNYAAYAKLLKRAVPGIVTERTAQTKPMPKGKGRTLIFRRYERLSVATTPLQEGITPPGTKPTYTDVESTVEQYGDWIGITDVIMDTHEDPIISEFRGLQSDQMRETREVLNINVIKGGTNVFYTNGAARSSVNTTLDRGDLRLITRDLRGADAKFYMEMLAGSPKYATEPVGPAYVGMGHTDMASDLQNVSGYTEVKNYAEHTKAWQQEHGTAENVRFMLTTLFDPWADAGGAKGSMLSTTGVSADVYPLIIVAPDAWATVPLRGVNSGNITVVNPTPTKDDILGQRGGLGWKFWHAAVILQDDWMARLETGATATPS